MAQPSRLEQGRRRLRTTRRVIGAGSVVAFAAFALVARAAHPGSTGAATQTAPATAVRSDDDDDQSGFFFGDPSISSNSSDQNAVPQTQSSGS
jgi:hypothetical protein